MKSLAKHLAYTTKLRLATDPKITKSIPHRVKMEGQFIVSMSGKTVWRNLAAAKSAMRLEARNQFHFIYQTLAYGYGPNNHKIKITSTGDVIDMTCEEFENFKTSYIQELLNRFEYCPVSSEDFYRNVER